MGYRVIESKCIVPEGTWKEAITLMQLIRRLTESSLPPTYAVLNDPPPRAIIIFHSLGIPENPDEYHEFDLFHVFPENRIVQFRFYIFLSLSFFSLSAVISKEKGVGRLKKGEEGVRYS